MRRDRVVLETEPPSFLSQTNPAFSTIARITPASNGAKQDLYLVKIGRLVSMQAINKKRA